MPYDVCVRVDVPPYVIFHDKTLTQMANSKPTNNAELALISGVGGVKIDKYGEEFLQVIANS